MIMGYHFRVWQALRMNHVAHESTSGPDDASDPKKNPLTMFESNSLDWLVVGGGLHGVHLAARLVGEAGVAPSRLGILDPEEQLLDCWRTFTAVTGMSHLRSPGVHHLDLEPFSLIRFAGQRRHRTPGLLRGRYKLPALDLFNAHCDRVIERYSLAGAHVRDHAKCLEPQDDHVRVTTRRGQQIEARRVVLAIGAGGQPAWPSWAPRGEAYVHHVFDRVKNKELSPTEGCLLVVGGGISAAQVALRFVAQGRKVCLVVRHPLRVHRFDSDPGWLGPKLMPLFRRERRPDHRRRILHEARHRGSVTPEVLRALRAAQSTGLLEIHQGAVSDLSIADSGICLSLASALPKSDARKPGTVIEGTHLYLATGFASRRPGGALLDRLVADFDLPCAACGYPIVDDLLRWHPRIHVSGPLAELELGPVSRNIAGARRAGNRLVAAHVRLGWAA